MKTSWIVKLAVATVVIGIAARTYSATVTTQTTTPTTGANDISQLVSSTSDTLNIGGTGITFSGENDAKTYVSSDRMNQGQTFTTGAQPAGYLLTAIWVRNVGYTTYLDNGTFASFASGQSISIRIIEPSKANTGGFRLHSEGAKMAAGSEFSGGGTWNGSGRWIKISLDTPVALAPNTQYGFDLTSPAANFELAGMEADQYGSGAGYTTTVREGLNTGTVHAGDRTFIAALTAEVNSSPLVLSNQYQTVSSLDAANVDLYGRSELHVTAGGYPLAGCLIDMHSVDSWVFLRNVKPSNASLLLSQFRVNGAAAVNNSNVKVVQYGVGSVIIPYPSGYQPMTVYDGENFSGPSANLSPGTQYTTVLGSKVSSFKLKRGYTATLANNANGTGNSVNYVAADDDLEIGALPAGLNDQVNFVRIYPWRWASKKGISGSIGSQLDIQWWYDWGTLLNSTPDKEWVPIRSARWYPDLNQDWVARGACQLLGYNEPDHADQANIAVGDAIWSWPDLLWTGLRVGSPAPADDGRPWLTNFMSQADAANLRVDFVAVHYYWGFNPSNPTGAANQMYDFLKWVYDRTKRPIWITEWNNGANWTGNDPTYAQQAASISAMMDMLDNTPWVERYAPYNWVTDVRRLEWNDTFPTDAGVAYRNKKSPIGYMQIIPKSRQRTASYYFEDNLNDSSGAGNNGVAVERPAYDTGKHGKAMVFDGARTYAVLPGDIVTSSNFTFAAWVYWDGGADWQRIFDFGFDTDQYLFLTPKAGGGNLRFGVRNGGSEQSIQTAAVLASGSWQHVTVTMSGTSAKIYVNGAEQASGTISVPALSGTKYNYLGKSQWPDALFDGRLDEVHIFNSVLSQPQISALMNTTPPTVGTNLVNGGTLTQGVPYSGTVAGTATDPDAGGITYSKQYGPAWLNVASNGALTGTPGYGVNSDQFFTIKATDADGAPQYFVLKIVAPPVDYGSGPIAYWDFNDPSLGAVEGAAVPDSDSYTVWRAGALDRSGRGNALTTWDYAWAGFKWSTNSQQKNFSIKSQDIYPAAFTWSAQSLPAGIDVETFNGVAFTVEAIATVSGSGSFRTVVGRDARNLSTGDAARAALYLGLDNANHARFQYSDINGKTVDLYSTTTYAANDFVFRHFAGVSDGSTVSLYVDGTLVAQATNQNMAGLGSGSTSSIGNYHAGGWSVGRGLYNGGHGDRWYGYIDAVAISGIALAPGSFVTETFGKSGYELYALAHGIPNAIFGGDDDGDRTPNGMEYYIGSSLTNPASPSKMLWWSNGHQSVRHPFNTSATGVTGSVEWTSSLVNAVWTNAGVTYFTNTALGEIEADLGTATTNNQLYVRLKVSQ